MINIWSSRMFMFMPWPTEVLVNICHTSHDL
jgi:hypothetical protein